MKKLLISFCGIIFFVLISVCSMGAVFAGTQDFIINNFDAKYVLTNQDKQGSLGVTETVDLTFYDNNHGILRAIPMSYKDSSIDLSDINVSSNSGAPTQFTTYESNGNTVLKIGDPNKTITGKQNYLISYSLSNVITFYDDHDEFYWNINGTEWQQPFENVSMTLALPTNLKLSPQLPVCYTGLAGARAMNCLVTHNTDTNTITAKTTQKLASGENMSAVVGFEKNYFLPVSAKEKALSLAVILTEAFGVPFILGGLAFKKWKTKGKDPKGRGVIVPQYDPPKGLLAAEVGTIVDFKVDQKDISATIIDLAIKKYIKIIEETIDRKIFKDKTSYSFELTNQDVTKLADYEEALLKGLFKDPDFTVGSVVKLDSLKSSFYTTVSGAKKSIITRLVDNHYFRSDPTKAGVILWAIAGVSLFGIGSFAALFGPGFTIGLVLSLPIVAAFAFVMPARTQLGVDAKEHALGLKMYLEVAEKDRIDMLQSPNAPLATNAHEPVRTVALFEKLLPYAVVFGVEKQWANEFKDIYKQPPEWYSSNVGTFNTLYIANALSGGLGASMNTAFAAPSSSGSSGFGGGGFSGGGGGGGGGGGW